MFSLTIDKNQTGRQELRDNFPKLKQSSDLYGQPLAEEGSHTWSPDQQDIIGTEVTENRRLSF